FFFFQAEDGIRDRNVTGVQTCALPIFFVGAETAFSLSICPAPIPSWPIPPRRKLPGITCWKGNTARCAWCATPPACCAPCPWLRSEERRVGKDAPRRGTRPPTNDHRVR